MKPAIRVLGAGRMGSALALALIQAGYRTTIWNRTTEKIRPLAAAGATVAAVGRMAVSCLRQTKQDALGPCRPSMGLPHVSLNRSRFKAENMQQFKMLQRPLRV
ncbi:NAD(P)-binding domain-containing protein [Ensifer adhaerens]|uniref:NAD(P)-binding domain-containing protein n=1 Tax=Ensifer adhaerens TaxID=106592 RepID=UPI00128F3ACA|nr:NAD(P)-binding domain-containing protein [Ensifer adhaerens]